ncbi:MAG: hypothetical protein LBV15_00520, partial [Planctomycetota bacterium]|nr:hypothetical protein [Planctomycetota bacterium]
MRSLLVRVMLAALAAAGSAAAGEITVVFIPKLTGNSFFEAANDGAQRYAERIGFNIKYAGSPEALVANQIAIIEAAV